MDSYWANTQTAVMNRDHLHGIIKRFREAFPDQFSKTDLKICLKCEGSGLPIKPKSDITFWQPGTYCTECSGFGVTGINKLYDDYLCKKCKGIGCDECNQRGTKDWISNVVKG